MLFNLKLLCTLGAMTLALSGCGVLGGGSKLKELPPAYPNEQAGIGGGPGAQVEYSGQNQVGYPPQAGSDYPAQPAGQPNAGTSPYSPSDAVQYDEVGYAGLYGDERGGAPTAVGGQYNPGSMSAAHATLPLPSYIEVTNLNTGKTVLIRVVDRAQAGSGRLIELSPAALSALGAESGSSLPIRVRRVNPPEPEKSALAMGRTGGDRLATPEPLLVALRKKLASSNPQVATGPAPKPVAKPVARPAEPQPKWTRPGANYDLPRAPQNQRLVVEQPAAPEGDDGYIREEGGGPRPVGQAPSPRSVGGYFVQIAAFSDRGRAENVARQMGARVERGGNVWRVRKGPYANEGAARAALGPVVAKGYRDARVTR